MKLDKGVKFFSISIVVLGATFAVQLGLHIKQRPQQRSFASWKDRPDTIMQAKELADQIVLAKVSKVQRADDLVVKAPGEPGDEDRIAIEVVTITVEKMYKGQKQGLIRMFHTGLSAGPHVKARQVPPEQQPQSVVLLEDDPPYQVGERYVLLLRDGPNVTVERQSVKTKAVISPEGRYRITERNEIEPVTERGFAGELKGKKLEELERLLQSD